jgi:hydrogenase 3 maturation protease
MQVIKRRLKAFLKGSTRVALLGVGSELCGDDAAGIMVARRLKSSCRKKSGIAVFFGFSAPENLTGPIKKFAPERLIIVDAASFKSKPGAIKIISSGKTLRIGSRLRSSRIIC